MNFIFILATRRQTQQIRVAGASESDIDPPNGDGVNAAFCFLYIQPVSSSSSCTGGASKNKSIGREKREKKVTNNQRKGENWISEETEQFRTNERERVTRSLRKF